MALHILKYKHITYILGVPNTEAKEGRYPAVLFLHGAGSRGTDPTQLLTNTITNYYREQRPNFVLIEPLCPADTWFDIYEQLLDFVSYIRTLPCIDALKITVTGNSLGGYACWQLAMSQPEWFSSAVPVCGGGMYWNAARLKNLPIWAFHGALDSIVFPEESIKMVNAVNASGGDAKLTLYSDYAHDSWIPTYSNPELYQWMTGQICRNVAVTESNAYLGIQFG